MDSAGRCTSGAGNSGPAERHGCRDDASSADAARAGSNAGTAARGAAAGHPVRAVAKRRQQGVRAAGGLDAAGCDSSGARAAIARAIARSAADA